MNEQYSDSWLRGGLGNPDHTEDPITGPTWIRRHTDTDRDRTNSQRDRETVRETNTIESFLPGSSQSKKTKSTELIFNKLAHKNLGQSHTWIVRLRQHHL